MQLTADVAREDLKIVATDGVALAATLHEAAHSPRAAVVLLGGTAIKRGYYDKFARYLASAGYSVLSIDYRGMGDSREPGSIRRSKATMEDWARLDAAGAVDFARRNLPNRKLLVFAHSFGGQAVGLMPNNHLVEGMLAVASQSGDYRLWPLHQRPRLMALWYVLSPAAVRAFGYLPAKIGIGEDLPPGVATNWAQWCRTKGFFFEALPYARGSYAKLRAPLHMISFSDDPFAPRRAAEALLSHYTGAIRTHEHLTPADLNVASIGHFDCFREQFRDSFWMRARLWLDQQIAG